MIIKREYVTFRHLCNCGDEGGEYFIKYLKESYDESMWEDVWNSLADYCLYQRNMDWAFCKIGDLIKAFKKLDREKPFDNGCSYEDINDVDIAMRYEDSITLHLMSGRNEDRMIVKVVEIKDGKVR